MRKSWMVFISVGMLSLISFTGCSDTKMPTQEENSISSMRESDLAVQERKEDIEENILVETPETEDIPVEPEPAVLLYQHLDFPAVQRTADVIISIVSNSINAEKGPQQLTSDTNFVVASLKVFSIGVASA